jgi:hypothetical protein
MAGLKIAEPAILRGYVDWELVDDKTGRVTSNGRGWIRRKWLGRRLSRILDFLTPYLPFLSRLFPYGVENALVNTARNKLANAFIGTATTYPQWIGIGTGTNDVGGGDTALQTLVHYDGTNDAKVADSKTLKGQFTSRIITQFTTAQANQSIRELGLFDAANSGNLWARVRVTINKTSSERLNVHWYIIFERRSSLAIKTGASIGATGTITANTDITLTFSSSVTIVIIFNNSSVPMYIKFNGALTSSPPTDYDAYIESGGHFIMSDEEIDVSTVHVYMNAAITMPHNNLTVRGW